MSTGAMLTKRQIKQLGLFWLLCLLTILACVPAIASTAIEKLKRPPELPGVCYAVFTSIHEAASHCPNRNFIVKVRDFWTGQVSGYSCYCGDLKLPQPTTP